MSRTSSLNCTIGMDAKEFVVIISSEIEAPGRWKYPSTFVSDAA